MQKIEPFVFFKGKKTTPYRVGGETELTNFINPFQIHNFTILMRCCCLVYFSSTYIPSSPWYFEAGQCSVTLREGYSALFCVVVLSIEPSKAIEKKVPPLSVDSLFRHSRKTLFVYLYYYPKWDTTTALTARYYNASFWRHSNPIFKCTQNKHRSSHKNSSGVQFLCKDWLYNNSKTASCVWVEVFFDQIVGRTHCGVPG